MRWGNLHFTPCTIPYFFLGEINFLTILSTASTWIFTSMVPVGLPVLAVLQISAYSTSQSDQSSFFEKSATFWFAGSTSLSWCLSPTCASTSSPTSSGRFSAQTWCLLSLVRKQLGAAMKSYFRGSELLEASAKGLIYWCTQPVPKKSCTLSQVSKVRIVFLNYWQIQYRYLDRSDELYSSYLLWKDSYRVETRVDKTPFPVPGII